MEITEERRRELLALQGIWEEPIIPIREQPPPIAVKKKVRVKKPKVLKPARIKKEPARRKSVFDYGTRPFSYKIRNRSILPAYLPRVPK